MRLQIYCNKGSTYRLVDNVAIKLTGILLSYYKKLCTSGKPSHLYNYEGRTESHEQQYFVK